MATSVAVGGKFKWLRWIGRPRKPYLRTKSYESILYTTKVMIVYIQEGRAVVGRSSLFIKLMSYTPLRYVRNEWTRFLKRILQAWSYCGWHRQAEASRQARRSAREVRQTTRKHTRMEASSKDQALRAFQTLRQQGPGT